MSYRYENLYIMHYGVPRKSGRFPWGSGDRPYQGDDMGKIKLDNIRLEARAKSAPEFEKSNVIKDAGGDFVTDSNFPPGDSVKYTGDPVRFTNQFNSRPIDDYKQEAPEINNTPKKETTEVSQKDITNALSDIEKQKKEKEKEEQEKLKAQAIKDAKKDKLSKNVTSDVTGIAGGINSMVKEVRLYQQGKLSDKAKKKLDKKIRKMSDAQLSELARRMNLESSAIEQTNRRKKLTAATGKSRTEHLMDLGLSGLNTTVSVIDLIASIRKLRAL